MSEAEGSLFVILIVMIALSIAGVGAYVCERLAEWRSIRKNAKRNPAPGAWLEEFKRR